MNFTKLYLNDGQNLLRLKLMFLSKFLYQTSLEHLEK